MLSYKFFPSGITLRTLTRRMSKEFEQKKATVLTKGAVGVNLVSMDCTAQRPDSILFHKCN